MMNWPCEFDPERESLTEYRDRLLLTAPYISDAARETLLTLRKVTFDGDVPSKTGRDELVHLGLAVRWNGYQVVTRAGMAMLDVLKRLEEMDRMKLARR
jgi:hypothetical protein